MKSLLVPCFSFLLLSGCQNRKPLAYEEGLEKCDNIRKEKQKANPNGFILETPECIIGAQIPAFEAVSLEGVTINRETLKGKPTVLNFWFTSCAPCVAEIPGFNAIVDTFGDQVNYVAIGRDEKAEVQEFLSHTPWKFQQITDGASLMKEPFKVQWGFPTTFLLNKDAEIILAFSGGKTDASAATAIQEKLIPEIKKALK